MSSMNFSGSLTRRPKSYLTPGFCDTTNPTLVEQASACRLSVKTPDPGTENKSSSVSLSITLSVTVDRKTVTTVNFPLVLKLLTVHLGISVMKCEKTL